MDTQILLFVAVAASIAGQMYDVYTTHTSTPLQAGKIFVLGVAAPLLTTILAFHVNGPGYVVGSLVGFASAAYGTYSGYKRKKAVKA